MIFPLNCSVWELTLKCNLSCSHCGSVAGSARSNELSTEEALSLCEQLADLNCEYVALMGGELFLRKDWYEVATCIKDLGMHLSIVSNGFVLDKHIKELKELKPAVVGISIDGLRKTHDSIRGLNGSYNKAINAINLLRRSKIQTTVITTISKLNFDDLTGLKELFHNKGINWQLQIATPFGNFKKEYVLTYEEFYAVGLFIASLRSKYRFENMPVVGAHCMGYHSKNIPNFSWSGCTAGRSTMGITSNGGIVGCLAMGNERFFEGNVREQSLRSIWNDKRNFSYNRQFTTKELGAFCKNCAFGVTCKGGCNSVSLGMTDQFHNNPYCFSRIEREIL